MFATIEEALAYGEQFRRKLQDVINNPEFRPPWVSAICSVYSCSDMENMNYFYDLGKRGMSQDELKLLDTAYELHKAALFHDTPPSIEAMNRLVSVIAQGGYQVEPRIRADIEKINEYQSQGKPELN